MSASSRPRPLRKMVLPVAGLGTRFLPATKAVPKEMLPVVDKPVIQYVVEEAVAAGIEQIIFVTGRGKGALEDHFDHSFELESTLQSRNKTQALTEVRAPIQAAGNVIYTRQQEPLGLGHAVWCARHLVGDEPFLVALPDVLTDPAAPCLARLIEIYGETGGNVLTLKEVPLEEVKKYGIAATGAPRGDIVEITGLVEKPDPERAPSRLHVLGRYILQPEIFGLLETQTRGAGGEIQLTDAMARLMERQPFAGQVFEGGFWDCGDKIGYLHANLAIGLSRGDIGPKLRPVLAQLQLEA
ncbi:MAG: UTP--glucose-1-phosphate uridylyltransferase GalU [Alphaproteobacteria bacterium]|nr:UTP--glucose-1-phosphate uridylyltransferase GalU [Alphaproteobacteria bacterium]